VKLFQSGLPQSIPFPLIFFSPLRARERNGSEAPAVMEPLLKIEFTIKTTT